MDALKKVISFLLGTSSYSKPTKAVEHYAVYQYNDGSSKQIEYGWHRKTASKMNVGDYACLPEAQAAGLYHGIVYTHGKKSAKTKFINRSLRKVTRVK
jgi:hypothetical protein